MTYQRLGVREFGETLIKSGDLDPVYLALSAADWPPDKKYRWLIAYWCFYSCGVASWMAELESWNFWTGMECAARNEIASPIGDRWPRGRERRHFRGFLAISSVEQLLRCYGSEPELMVANLLCKAPSYRAVAQAVEFHKGFGPWISFKVCDMIDRVLGIKVDFTEAEVFMFKDPVKGAKMVWETEHGPIGDRREAEIIHQVVEELTQAFSGFLAPPRFDRPVGLQEVETVLCKWKSHRNGHYPVGNDIHEIRRDLLRWAEVCQTANEFLKGMPQ